MQDFTCEIVSDISDRDCDIECLHNIFKSHYGCRPRHYDFDMMQDSDIRQAINELQAQIAGES